MKSLIIPDIHNHHNLAEEIISVVKPDQTVFLGDHWDDFGDTYAHVCATAEWFRWSVNQKDRIHLAGNHDIHYWFAHNSGVRCGGYEQGKSQCINDFVKPEHWRKLKFFHVLDDWFLTHGGIHPYWIDKVKYLENQPVTISKDELVKKLTNDSINCRKQLTEGRSHWFEEAGFARSSSSCVGGLLWCDFNKEFEPIRGIHQIVGHTPDRKHVRWLILKENDHAVYASPNVEPELSDKNSFNVCFDSYPALKWYAIYEQKRLKIFKTENIKEEEKNKSS